MMQIIVFLPSRTCHPWAFKFSHTESTPLLWKPIVLCDHNCGGNCVLTTTIMDSIFWSKFAMNQPLNPSMIKILDTKGRFTLIQVVFQSLCPTWSSHPEVFLSCQTRNITGAFRAGQNVNDIVTKSAYCSPFA